MATFGFFFFFWLFFCIKKCQKTLKDVIVELNEIKFKEYENRLVRSWIDCLWGDKDGM